MHADTSLIIYVLLGVIVVLLVAIVWIWMVQVKLNRFLKGKNAASLEDSIMSVYGELSELKQFTKDMKVYLTTVEKRLKKSVQSVETIRFNPFRGTGEGGNQSFSSAFLNEYGTGLVLTSMYSRDRISMFAKPIKNFTSEFELSEEEREAIEAARKNLPGTN
jgi:hypothetical protein